MTDLHDVTVVNIDLPFGSIVLLILKWTCAAIPALFILGLIGAVGASLVAAVLAMMR